jgi:hypothetical protein
MLIICHKRKGADEPITKNLTARTLSERRKEANGSDASIVKRVPARVKRNPRIAATFDAEAAGDAGARDSVPERRSSSDPFERS